MPRDLRTIQRKLGARIQSLRQDRGLTQEEVARRCGISQKFLSDLERGEKTASLETMVALAHDGFHVRIAALFAGVDEAVPNEVRRIDELLAGLDDPTRERVLAAVDLLVRPVEDARFVSCAAEPRLGKRRDR